MIGTPFIIRNDWELSQAIKRAEELAGCAKGSDEERELAAIAKAVDAYVKTIRNMLVRQADNDNSGLAR